MRENFWLAKDLLASQEGLLHGVSQVGRNRCMQAYAYAECSIIDVQVLR